MQKLFPIVLIVAGLVLAVMGITTYQDSTASVDVLGIDINASDESGQMGAIMYFILGAIGIGAGYMLYRK